MIRVGKTFRGAGTWLDALILAVAPGMALRRELARRKLEALRRAAERRQQEGPSQPPERWELLSPYRTRPDERMGGNAVDDE